MSILKVFHVLFVFIWIGSLLALSRLLGYLNREQEGVQKRLILIFRRMYLYVDMPSMIAAVLTGIALFIWKGADFKQGWLHMKWTFSFFLIIADVTIGRMIIGLKGKTVSGKGVKFKIIHSIVALLLIGILFCIYVIKNCC